MDSMICGLQGVAPYLDDIIVTGHTYEEHCRNLETLLNRISEYGFHVRLVKCHFLMPMVRYLGFILDKDGRRPDPEKIEAVRQMPVPWNVAEVRSFLGMISYYGSFVAEMRQIRAPLDELLKKNVPSRWTSKCDEAFKRAKEVLSSDLLLTHFDPSLEIIVAADASDYGIGAVILHKMPDRFRRTHQRKGVPCGSRFVLQVARGPRDVVVHSQSNFERTQDAVCTIRKSKSACVRQWNTVHIKRVPRVLRETRHRTHTLTALPSAIKRTS
nr:RNA-directed DNA polymerase (reverse transcriptase) domain containing protein [Haemonchus contortus]